jgi:hypothetical protein
MDWQAILVDPMKEVIAQAGKFVGKMVLMLVIILVGSIISKGIQSLITKVLKTIKVDDLADRIEIDAALAKGGIKSTLSELIGIVFYWLGLLITFVIAVNAVGLTATADLLSRVVLYVPNIIAATFILIMGLFVSTVMRNIVQTAAANAGISIAKTLANIAQGVILVFAVIITLDQLGINTRIVDNVITIVLAAIGLAAAISFGFGCQGIAAKYMQEWIEKLKK